MRAPRARARGRAANAPRRLEEARLPRRHARSARRGRARSRGGWGSRTQTAPTRSFARSRSIRRDDACARPCPRSTSSSAGAPPARRSRPTPTLVDTVARDLARLAEQGVDVLRRALRRDRAHARLNEGVAAGLTRASTSISTRWSASRSTRASARRATSSRRAARSAASTATPPRSARSAAASTRWPRRGARGASTPSPASDASPSCATPTRITCSSHGVARRQVGRAISSWRGSCATTARSTPTSPTRAATTIRSRRASSTQRASRREPTEPSRRLLHPARLGRRSLLDEERSHYFAPLSHAATLIIFSSLVSFRGACFSFGVARIEHELLVADSGDERATPRRRCTPPWHDRAPLAPRPGRRRRRGP